MEGKPVLLVFSDANCGPCKALIPDLVRWQGAYSDKLTFAVITRGASREKIASDYDLKNVFVQKDREAAEQYQVFGTPTAILVGLDGLVASHAISGGPAIGGLVTAAARGDLPVAPAPHAPQRAMPAALPIGSQAPAVTLPDLAGKAVELGDLLRKQPRGDGNNRGGLQLGENRHCLPAPARSPRMCFWTSASATPSRRWRQMNSAREIGICTFSGVSKNRSSDLMISPFVSP